MRDEEIPVEKRLFAGALYKGGIINAGSSKNY